MPDKVGWNVVVVSKAQWLAYLLPDPASPGSIPAVPIVFKRKKMLMLLLASLITPKTILRHLDITTSNHFKLRKGFKRFKLSVEG